jgi:hypothetical protein
MLRDSCHVIDWHHRRLWWLHFPISQPFRHVGDCGPLSRLKKLLIQFHRFNIQWRHQLTTQKNVKINSWTRRCYRAV